MSMYHNMMTSNYLLFDSTGELIKEFEGVQGADFEEQSRALMK
ncbi:MULTISPECIES: hypothetical protein [Myroides]|nr:MULTISPECIES: hypothetical protein [Myroides]UVD80803.1 hypothetical protein NWE55_06055 [Myroides albus]